MKVRTLIVDDEPLARQGLAMSLARESDIELVGMAGDGLLAISLLRQSQIDLVFLDIEMPGLDGLEVARLVQGPAAPLIIFVTAYDQYAVRAFDRAAVDYLVKPISPQRLSQAIDRAKVRLRERSGQPAEAVSPAATSHKFIQQIPVEEIVWIEAEDYYARMHTIARSVLIRESLNALERTLDPVQFRRVHRSAIVARRYVDRLELPPDEARIILRNQHTIRVGRTYLASVRDWLRS